MNNLIHKTAIVSDKAKIGNNVKIDAYAIIEDNVVIGDNTKISSHAVIKEYTMLGKNNIVHSHAVLGNLPQDISFDRVKRSYLVIGDNNEFREFSNVHRSAKEEGKTFVGNNCYIMATGHIAHDCEVSDNVIICNGSLVAGHVHLGKNVFISGNCVIHQFCSIGSYAMISGMTAVGRDILPYSLTSHGGEAVVYKINIVGLRRAGFSSDDIKEAEYAHNLYYDFSGLKSEFLEKYLNDNSLSDVVKYLVEFVSKSKRGITPRIK